MSDVNVVTPPAPQEPVAQPVQPDVNAQLASSMWGDNFAAPQPTPEPPPAAPQPAAPAEPPAPEPTIVDANEWLKQTYGWDNAEAGKQELERLRQLQETAQTPAEIKFANEESRRYFDAISNGKVDDLYNILHQQRQLDRLEKLELTSAKEAADIIKANLQFKHKDLQSHEVERIFNRQYALPAKPQQGMEQTDEDYAAVVEQWKMQVAEKEQDMIIDAKLAKPELSKYKSELVLPDIPKVEPQPQGPSQEDLAKVEAFRNNFTQHLERDYNKFTGFTVTAKDGGVELPITYGVTPEELNASKQELKEFNVNEFLDNRWFDDKGNPNITAMQKDVYVLKNLDKILQKIANEASAQRAAHDLAVRNNINLHAVNNGGQQSNGAPVKSETERLAEVLWR